MAAVRNFIQSFYNLVRKDCHMFKSISQQSSLLLGMELSNHIMAHLICAETAMTGIIQPSLKALNYREMTALVYLIGSVCGTLYWRLRKSAKGQEANLAHDKSQYLALLLATKVAVHETQSSHKLLNAKNRGGLSGVKDDIIMIFRIAETLFVSTTATDRHSIDAVSIVDKLLANPVILSFLSSVCSSADVEICKEMRLNLLEQMLTLFIRIWAFSYAKDIRNEHKRLQKSITQKVCKNRAEKGKQ